MDYEEKFNRLLEQWMKAKERELKAMKAVGPLFAATSRSATSSQPPDVAIDEYLEATTAVIDLQKQMTEVVRMAFSRR